MAISLVTQGGTGNTKTGSWSSGGTDNPQYSSTRSFAQCTGTATPTHTQLYKFGGVGGQGTLTAGTTYLLAITIPTLSNRQADQVIKVYDSDGTTVLCNSTMNGQVAFSDFTYATGAAFGSPTWLWLGQYTPSSNASGASLTIYTDNSGADSTKYAIGDAAYIQLATDSYTPVYGSCQSGNWSSASTWKFGVPPSSALVTIGYGHTVTVDTNTTHGSSPTAGNDAVNIQNLASLIVADGATFTCRGGVKLTTTSGASRVAGYFPLQIGTGTNGGGAIFEFDASQAVSPSTAIYTIGPSSSAQTNAWVKMRGTQGNRAQVRSNASGANGRFSLRSFVQNSTGGLGMLDAQDCDFIRLGNSTLPAFENALRLSGEGLSMVRCSVQYCWGGGGGADYAIGVSFNGDGTYATFTDVTFSNTQATYSLALTRASGTTLGTITVQRCVFDKVVAFFLTSCFGTAYFQDNIYNHQVRYTNATSTPALDTGHFFYMRAANDGVPSYSLSGNMTNAYFLADKTDDSNPSTTGNPHYVGAIAGFILTGAVFDYIGEVGLDVGDTFTADGGTCILRHSIVLKGTSTGTAPSAGTIWCPNAVTSTLTLEHNTIYCSHGSLSGLNLGHTEIAGTAGSVPSVKSNIFHATNASVHGISCDVQSFIVNDFITPAGITANTFNGTATGTSNIVNGVSGQSIIGMQFLKVSAQPTGNLTTAPAFVDSTVNFLSWAVSQGCTGTNDQKRDAALALIAATPTLVRTSLLPHVRAGLRTTATALRTAGHDSAPIGACNYGKTTRTLTALTAFRTNVNTRYSISV